MLDLAARLKPDVIIADVSMPLLSGIEAVRHLREKGSRSKIVFLSMHADMEFAAEALSAGASGYVIKQSAAEELTRAIKDVLKNRTYVTPRVGRDQQGASRQAAKPGMLTSREREVLQLVAEGRSSKEIADLLSISPATVETHRTHVLQKLGLRNTAEVVRYAARRGIVT